MYELGFIHGRFQVLHNDHLAYLLAGKELCRHLVVGITNPDPVLTKAESSDPERSDPASNPLTYWERSLMVRACLADAGLGTDEFTVTPFPVSMPELYKYYLPPDPVCFLTIYDDWGRAKKARFEEQGLKTHILWERPSEQKGITGRDVRRRIMSEQDWKSLVPEPTARLIEEWGLKSRLQNAAQPI